MPNGKGTLDCCYCVHFDGTGYPDGHGAKRHCRFHQRELPKATVDYYNRICCHFEPNQTYYDHNPFSQFSPVARRIAWFGIDLEPGVLYEFPYPAPHQATKLAVLRIADFDKVSG